jgi:hypothetical protein
VLLCGPCHRKIHQTFTEAELEREYPTVEALVSDPEIGRFVAWVYLMVSLVIGGLRGASRGLR